MRYTVWMFLVLFLGGCAISGADDPLKQSKKLIAKGHTSLYQNGAIEVPFTTIHFIPSAKDSIDRAHELFFEDATASLKQALKDALDSVYLIPEGTKKAYEFSGKLFRASSDLSDEIRKYTRGKGTWLVSKSSQLAKDHIIGAFSSAYQTGKNVYAAGEEIQNYFDVASGEIFSKSWERSKKYISRTSKSASKINKVTERLAAEHFAFGTDSFIQGYAALPKNLGENLSTMAESIDTSRFVESFKEAEAVRSEGTLYFTDMISDAISSYGSDVGKSFAKAGENFSENIQKEGVLLTTLKSMRWVLQGIFYDGIIKPVSKIAVGSVGLISVNGIIYPVHIIANEAGTTTMVAVEVTYESAKSIYQIVAPSVTFALASVLSSTEYLGGKAAAAVAVTGGAAVSIVDTTVSTAAAGIGKTTGFVLGSSTKYLGVPLAVSAKAVGEVSYGVLASTSAATLGTGVAATGEVAALATQATGTALSGTAMVAGSGITVATAAAKGVYHLAEAVVMPVGYSFSSATVLGYSTLSQLSAHTILAASDAAYVVLSLEGPKWVLYTISGGGSDEKQPPVGAVVDMKKIEQNDKKIKRLDVSDEEMERLLSNLQEDLPEYEKE